MGEREGRAPEPNQDAGDRERAPAPMSALPPEFLSTIQQVPPDLIGAMLREHPDLAAPILAVVHQYRGNAIAQAAVAAAASAPLHKKEQDADPTVAPARKSKAAPVMSPEPVVDAERAKHIERGKVAAWNQLAAGPADERAYPTSVRIPANIVKDLDKAWEDTLATKVAYEQGGNLVKHYGGDYGTRRKPNKDANLFDQDDHDVGRLDTLVAQVHTHPYREEKTKVPEGFASFSDGDFDSLMRSQAHMSVLRSGPYTFVLAKTKQFEKLVEATRNDETALSDLAGKMTKTFDKAMAATEGMFSEKIEAGVLAVCEAFHLVYYSGQGGELEMRSQDK